MLYLRYFDLEKDTGVITMKHGIPEGRYILQFKVYDRKHTQTDVPANVTVVVKEIPHEAVVNSGSFRIVGMTAEDFVRIWDYEKETVVKSKLATEQAFCSAVRTTFVGSITPDLTRSS